MRERMDQNVTESRIGFLPEFGARQARLRYQYPGGHYDADGTT